MADVRIAGNTVVITSTVTLEQIKRLEKHRPEALEVRNAKDEVTFRVGTGSNSLNTFGASFNSATLDERKLALIQIEIPDGVTDAKTWFAETYGKALVLLKQVEAELNTAIRVVAGEINVIMRDIQFSDGAAQTAAPTNPTETEEE